MPLVHDSRTRSGIVPAESPIDSFAALECCVLSAPSVLLLGTANPSITLNMHSGGNTGATAAAAAAATSTQSTGASAMEEEGET